MANDAVAARHAWQLELQELQELPELPVAKHRLAASDGCGGFAAGADGMACLGHMFLDDGR